LKRGPLRIVISTSGISPALSRAIRKELEKLYGLEFNVYLRFLKGIRTKAVKIIQDKKKRREFLKTVASEKMIKMLRRKGLRETKKVVDDLLKRQRVT
jgi:precorrin-2 dehydrogenase/sirohydrochlorin ferrochelatase